MRHAKCIRYARSAGRRVELTDTSASAAFIAAMNASQLGRKSLASALVVLASGNRATHCAPLSSFCEGGMIDPIDCNQDPTSALVVSPKAVAGCELVLSCDGACTLCYP